MEIEVLRLGHRLPRDERISTHVALVARAFGADAVTYSGAHDSGLEESVSRICERWGGNSGAGKFSIKYEKSALSYVKKMKKENFTVLHLTMYGLPVMDKLPEIRASKKLLIIVGSEAVPAEIYQLADFNIAITNQPHSEVAALAIALDRILDGKALSGLDYNGKIKIEPSGRGKKVVETGHS
jgi:tRNA (cytidine56-2'-O)-methyltransferase